MSLANYKTFVAGEVLTAADLNGLQSHFTSNALALISPITGTLDMNGNILILDTDADSTLRETSDDVIALRLQGMDAVIFDGDVELPVNGFTLRSSATGQPVDVVAQGTDTNIGIRLIPKGTGTVIGSSNAVGNYAYAFDSATAMADPGSGDFRLNNATPASATAIAISDTDSLGLDRDTVLDGTVGFLITFASLANPTVFVRYHVYALTDNGTWHQLDVAFKQTFGTLSNTDPCIISIEAVQREVLAAARTYFVRTDGNDANTGLVNSSAGALLTLQGAANKALTVDQNGFAVTIQVGAGTYTTGVNCSVPFSGSVQFTGDTTTPGNVIVAVTNSTGFLGTGEGVDFRVAGFKLTAASSGGGVRATTGAIVTVNGNMEYGACATSHVSAAYQGRIVQSANYSITGGSAYHFLMQYKGSVVGVALTVTLTGTPAFSVTFANAYGLSLIQVNANTYSGAATGTRYTSTINSFIETAGGGANYLPGDGAGSTATGGVYN